MGVLALNVRMIDGGEGDSGGRSNGTPECCGPFLGMNFLNLAPIAKKAKSHGCLRPRSDTWPRGDPRRPPVSQN